jgi:hypothetical protein
MRYADVIWALARDRLGNICSQVNSNLCFDRNINPAFLLAMVQRESGLVYGNNSKWKDDSQFLIDRATGYLCLETTDRTQTCYDENPNWKYYKGLFRQTYYMYRNLMLNSARCATNGVNMTGGLYRVGNTIRADDESVELQTNIACSLYIYTPHIFAQKSLYRSFKNIVE